MNAKVKEEEPEQINKVHQDNNTNISTDQASVVDSINLKVEDQIDGVTTTDTKNIIVLDNMDPEKNGNGVSTVPADNINAVGTKHIVKGPAGQSLQFPFKLHEMLRMAEETGKDHIISWLPEGRGFKVHNKEAFCEHIMPKYFASNKYKTFQRSLNLWGFESVSKGPSRGACYHELFVKGQPELCHSMNRVKVKGKNTRSDGNSKQIPPSIANATFPLQAQGGQPGNIASFIRGNTAGMTDPNQQAQAAALAMAAAANPQLAMMNAAAAASFFNPAMMGFHPAMLGMNPAMSAAFFNPAMLGLQQQQQQQQQATTMSLPNNNTMNMPAPTVTALAVAVGGGSSNQSGGGDPSSTAEV